MKDELLENKYREYQSELRKQKERNYFLKYKREKLRNELQEYKQKKIDMQDNLFDLYIASFSKLYDAEERLDEIINQKMEVLHEKKNKRVEIENNINKMIAKVDGVSEP